MGQAAVSILSAMNCEDFHRYVLNSMECDSRCNDYCEVHFQTNEIEIMDSESDIEIEVESCCLYGQYKSN